MGIKYKECDHLKSIEVEFPTQKLECKDCISLGDDWVHLRLCLTCGYIGCCDSSKNKHASKHAEDKKHPVIISAEVGEKWAWCYEHKLFKKL